MKFIDKMKLTKNEKLVLAIFTFMVGANTLAAIFIQVIK